MKEGNFPFKDNSGTKKEDLDRGFGQDKEPDEEFIDLLHPPEAAPFPNGGFLGRAKGWER